MTDEDYLTAVLNCDDQSGMATDAAWRAVQWFGGYRVLPMAGAPSPTRVSPSTKAKRRAANRAARKQRRANRRG